MDQIAVTMRATPKEMAEFIIVDSGIVESSNSNTISSSASSSTRAVSTSPIKADYLDFDQLEGDRVPATKLHNNGDIIVGYSGDFSEYAAPKDGIRYEIYFSLMTKDGVQYILPYNNIASFSYQKNGTSRGTSSGTLVPIFE